tara:strand:+ start:1306 stop:3444 length:2139 start_codon:yes stop_codon:yes gene_type:complete
MSKYQKSLLDKYGLEKPSMSYADATRIFLGQGLAMRFGDEAVGILRGIIDPDLTIDEAIEEEREAIKTAQAEFPSRSLALEIGGAVIPAIALAPFTGGASIPATIGRYALGTGGRLMTQGAIQGGATAVGGLEGDITERLVENPGTIVGSTAFGAVMNPVAQKVMGGVVKLGAKLFDPLIRTLRGQLGRKVEDEVLRISELTGELDPDVIVKKIAEGEIIADISEEGAKAVKSFYNSVPASKTIISEAVERRAADKTREVTSTLQRELVPVAPEESIVKIINSNDKQFARMTSDAYDEVYKRYDKFRSLNLNLAVQEILQKQPSLRGKLKDLMTALGSDIPFVVKKGVLKITKDIDLKTAEKLRGLLNQKVTKFYKDGDGLEGEAADILEKNIRNVIDNASPDLAITRAKWKKYRTGQTNYNLGKDAFKSKGSDEIGEEFNKILNSGDKYALEMYRAGVGHALRIKFESRNMTTFIRGIADGINKIPTKDRKILNTVYPGDELAIAIQKATQAEKSIITRNTMNTGNVTQELEAGSKFVGDATDLSLFGDIVIRGNLGSAFPLVSRFVKKLTGNNKGAQFTPTQAKKIASILVSENPELVKNALTNKEARNELFARFGQLVDGFIAGTTKAGIQQTTESAIDALKINPAQSAELDPNMNNMGTEEIDTTAIKSLADSISSEARNKILSIRINSGNLVDEESGNLIRRFGPNE